MALDKIVDSRQLDADLLSIANAIREKSGSARPLNFPADFVTEIGKLGGDGLTDEIKQAILQLGQKVAYIDAEGQAYYNDLYNALYPPKTVILLTAVFRQGSTVIYDDTALDSLKQYLQVTAKYDDNTTSILPDSAYTLSGLLEAPSSTVTVLYNGVSTTFSVAVTARPTLSSISAVYTQSGTVYDTDTLDSLKADLVVTAHYSDSSTQTVPAADYTLSGTLTAGTSTITVSYGGKTTTFSVTVSTTKLYTLYNHTFHGQDALNTGLDLLSTDRDFTIAIDVDMEQSLRQGGALANWALISCVIPSSPYSGISIKAENATATKQLTFEWMSTWLSTQQLTNFAAFDYDYVGRLRFVYSHAVGSGSVTIKCKIGDNAITTTTLSQTFISGSRNNVILGGTLSNSQDFVGTITSLVIDGVVWDDTRINNFLA